MWKCQECGYWLGDRYVERKTERGEEVKCPNCGSTDIDLE